MPGLRDMKSPISSTAAKMEENSSVSEHILKMSGYHNHLTQLGQEYEGRHRAERVLNTEVPYVRYLDHEDVRLHQPR